jgi:YggT family protein
MALDLYIWVLIISAILSWLVAFNVVNTSNRVVYVIGDVLYRLTEPALRPIRRFIPYLGGIDVSPVVLILGIVFVQMVLRNLLVALHGGAAF